MEGREEGREGERGRGRERRGERGKGEGEKGNEGREGGKKKKEEEKREGEGRSLRQVGEREGRGGKRERGLETNWLRLQGGPGNKVNTR